MRVLVTGATGFLGQHLVSRLQKSGFNTSLLVREAYGMGHPLPPTLAAIRPELHLVYADLRNFRLTSRAVAQASPEVVFHLAAAGVTDPYLSIDAALRHNTVGTINLLRATFDRSRSARQLIVTRTPGEQNPTNAYQASKAAAWSFCQMYVAQESWPIHGATVFQAYGPGQPEHALIPSAMSAALEGNDFAMTSGAQERDWVYVDDVVDALIALTRPGLDPGLSVDIGSGQATPLLDVVNTIYGLVGKGGRPLAGALTDRPGEAKIHVADSQTTRARTGWQASISLREGLQRLLETYVDQDATIS